MQTTVSIIIPTYNRASFIQQTILSVLDQTLQDFEIIIIDDNSNDNTKEIVDSFFHDDRIIYLKNSKNMGPGAARNIGLKIAKGKYIAFLDSDDLWLPKKLETQIRYMEENPQFHLVYSNGWMINTKGETIQIYLNKRHNVEGNIFPDLLKRNFIMNITVMMRRGVFETIGLLNEDLSIVAVEDYEYWLRVSMHFNIGYINEPLALYRIHTENISKAKSVAILRQRVLKTILHNYNCPQKFYEQIENIIERLNYSASVYCWKNSDKANAKRYVRRYISFNIKKAHPLNIIMGFILFILINFNYGRFRNFINMHENIAAELI